MKQVTNESSLTKNPANLDDIINNTDKMETLLNSREFLTNLVNDLINNKRNVVEWKLVDGSGSVEDVDHESLKNSFGVDYSFDFKYRYNGQIIPLTIFITGDVYFKRPQYRDATHMQPAEGGEAVIDDQDLGNQLDLSLFDKDGSEVNISWLTPELEKQVTKSIIKDYV